MRKLLQRSAFFVFTSPARFTVLVFLLFMVLLPQTLPNGNEDARVATMAALATEHTFALTNYQWTQDWAVSPTSGKTYANKPPLPAILGAPVYWLLDQFGQFGRPRDVAVQREERFQHRRWHGHVIALLLQALPFAWLSLLAGRWLQSIGASLPAVQFGVLGILFGTTASLFMNSFFGHGLAAFFVLAAVMCWLKRWYAASGLLVSGAALSDYGALLIIIPLAVGIIVRERRRFFGPLLKVAAGLALPAAIWALYHWTVFGHPLYLASRYSNPEFVGVTSQYVVWGLFSSSINGRVLLDLLVGSHRGLLYTQPWILVSVLTSVVVLMRQKDKRPDFVPLLVVACGSIGLMLLANSSFNGWEGGWTAGPRYLSSILPVFGLLAAMVYTAGQRLVRLALWFSLAVSIVLFVAAYSTTILAETAPLWPFYWRRLAQAIRLQPVVAFMDGSMLGIIAAAAAADIYIQNGLARLNGKFQS